MTGSPIFSVNFTKIPANLNCRISIKKSQAILKCFIDLKSSVFKMVYGLYKNIREILRFMCKVSICCCQYSRLFHRQIFREMFNILYEYSENELRQTLLTVLSS